MVLSLKEVIGKIRSFVKTTSLFPQRIVAFYSGANNKLFPNIKAVNASYGMVMSRYNFRCYTKYINSDNVNMEPFESAFPKRKYNYCDESFYSNLPAFYPVDDKIPFEKKTYLI